MLDVNLKGTFLCSQVFARQRVGAGGGGAIVNLASTAGFSARVGAAHYSASKAGVVMLTKSMAQDGNIKIWMKTGRIGRHSEALRNSIEQRIKETNRDQAQLRELSETQALQGARRIAAALTLGQSATVAVPGEEQEREGALDSAAILPEWTPRQRTSLISRGIFDPATYGRVRFHHREVREFLTAEWLLDRLKNGCTQEKIEELILTEKHGFIVVRPTLRAVAAWLGQRHEGIRKRLLKDAPEVLIEAGDPSLMSVEARIEFLRRFAERYRGRKDSGASINLDNVKHFVDTGLTGVIEELWREHTGSEEVRELLLRLIWQGGLQGNARIAEDVLRSSTSTAYERSIALKALAAAGSDLGWQGFCSIKRPPQRRSCGLSLPMN